MKGEAWLPYRMVDLRFEIPDQLIVFWSALPSFESTVVVFSISKNTKRYKTYHTQTKRFYLRCFMKMWRGSSYYCVPPIGKTCLQIRVSIINQKVFDFYGVDYYTLYLYVHIIMYDRLTPRKKSLHLLLQVSFLFLLKKIYPCNSREKEMRHGTLWCQLMSVAGLTTLGVPRTIINATITHFLCVSTPSGRYLDCRTQRG